MSLARGLSGGARRVARPSRRRPRHPGVGAAVTPSTVELLEGAGLDVAEVTRIVRTALTEDLGPAGVDVTSVATIPADQTDTGDLVARADGVVAGLAVARAVFEQASDGNVS